MKSIKIFKIKYFKNTLALSFDNELVRRFDNEYEKTHILFLSIRDLLYNNLENPIKNLLHENITNIR